MNIFLQILFFSGDSNSLDHLFLVHKSTMTLLFSLMGILLFVAIFLAVWLILSRRKLRRREAEYQDQIRVISHDAALKAQEEREQAWRTMARQVAHEINNPLTPMQLKIQFLKRLQAEQDERFETYFRENADTLLQQIDQLHHIATNFSTFAKRPIVRIERTDVAKILSGVIGLMRSNELNIPIRYVGADGGLFAIADPEQIGEVFTNIIKNALQALEETQDGDIIVTMTEQNNEVKIAISDNGPGIPEELRDKIFLPNFTTKSTGAGLGLAISKNIVETGGGRIEFETTNHGTTFYIYLKTNQN